MHIFNETINYSTICRQIANYCSVRWLVHFLWNGGSFPTLIGLKASYIFKLFSLDDFLSGGQRWYFLTCDVEPTQWKIIRKQKHSSVCLQAVEDEVVIKFLLIFFTFCSPGVCWLRWLKQQSKQNLLLGLLLTYEHFARIIGKYFISSSRNCYPNVGYVSSCCSRNSTKKKLKVVYDFWRRESGRKKN